MSVVVPLVKELWNKGDDGLSATSVTATEYDVLADQFWLGTKVTDNPSADNAVLPATFVVPCWTVIVPDTIDGC